LLLNGQNNTSYFAYFELCGRRKGVAVKLVSGLKREGANNS